MDSTSIITQVNKDDESAEVSPYTQNKREYAFTTSILLTLLRYKYAVPARILHHKVLLAWKA